MRFADLLGLSLSALRQQKARTVLTTLGVVFGTFVLVVSLSLGQGVQRTIEREARGNVHLRKVEVWPNWQGKEADVPEEELQVKGAMSEEKRQRLRQALLERKSRYNPAGPRLPLDRKGLQALADLEHVEEVTPTVHLFGWAIYRDQARGMQATSAAAGDVHLRQRIVAGDFFQAPDERAAVISEYLCYLLGITDDDAVAGLVGRTLRLEFRHEQRASGFALYLLKGDRDGLSREEQVAVEKVKRQLPEALDKFQLSPRERQLLGKAVTGPPRAPEVHAEEVTIAGVLRLPTKEELTESWDRWNIDADIWLPQKTAEEMFFRQRLLAEGGVDRATVLVDREDNVRAVTRRIVDMGLRASAPLEYIERERFIYTMIFTTMACVAAVALLVAALGIANTMLMSVLERTREIGIFKAVGATDGAVQLIFLIEGACLGAVGGGLGVLLGWAGSIPADAWIRSLVSRDLKIELKESLFVFPPWLTAGVVAFAVLVTTLAAVYPARRAARVTPLTALRHE
jgi:putative ABC transport system permease protein